MDIIIVGCGRVGRTITKQLSREGHNVTAIDISSRAIEKIEESHNVMTIKGNGATFNILDEAGIKSCDLIIAVTEADELNLYTCLIAKNAGVKRTIARVRNPEYTKDIPRLKDELKLSMAINPEQTCAREIARLLKYSGAIEIDTFAKGFVDLIKFRIRDNSPLANKKIVEKADLLKNGVRICLVERDKQCYIPNGDFEILPGDIISVVGSAKSTMKLLKKLNVNPHSCQNIMILGGGRISYYLAKSLSETGAKVKIIERNMSRCEVLSESLDNALIIHGNGMDQDFLISEGIEHTDAVVTLMNSDEENIIMSLFAKEVNPNAKIVTEINNFSFKTIIDSLPLDTIIHPKFITGDNIVKYVKGMQNSVGSNIETSYSLFGEQAEALEFRVREECMVVGVPLSMLELKPDLQIACINRHGKIIIPNGTDTIELNDTVIVITKQKGLSDLKDILL